METIAPPVFAEINKILNLILDNYQYAAILIMPFLSGMLYDFFQKGMIFEIYGNWVFKEWRRNEEIKRINGTRSTEEKQLELLREPWWKKPLGQCLKCFHIWVCIIFGFSFLPGLRFIDVHVFPHFLFVFKCPSGLGFNIIKFILSISVSYFILVRKYYR